MIEMRALLRQLDAAGMPVAVDLVYWVRQRSEQCFAGELAALAARHRGFRYQLAVTGDDPAPAPRVGGFDFSGIAGLAERRVLACGPAGRSPPAIGRTPIACQSATGFFTRSVVWS